MNYEDDMIIEPTALDVEWLEQPALMMKYARKAAEARRYLDQMKEKMELVKAEVDKKIRTNPERFGIEKITENAVYSTVITQQEYKKANETLIEAKFEADIAQAAVIAVSQRKDALEHLVRLHGQQYFAGPKIPRDLGYEATKREKQKEINKGVKISSNLTRSR